MKYQLQQLIVSYTALLIKRQFDPKFPLDQQYHAQALNNLYSMVTNAVACLHPVFREAVASIFISYFGNFGNAEYDIHENYLKSSIHQMLIGEGIEADFRDIYERQQPNVQLDTVMMVESRPSNKDKR